MESYTNQPHERFESESLNELFMALSKAQGEMEAASKNSANSYYGSDYSNLYGLVVSSRPHLAKNGLAVVQRIVERNKSQYLYTRLCHSSGQWMESKVALTPQKQDIQSLGSYITYQRRYSYGAIVGIVVKDDNDDPNDGAGRDDDGNKAMLEKDLPKKEEKKTPKPVDTDQEKAKVKKELINNRKILLKNFCDQHYITTEEFKGQVGEIEFDMPIPQWQAFLDNVYKMFGVQNGK